MVGPKIEVSRETDVTEGLLKGRQERHKGRSEGCWESVEHNSFHRGGSMPKGPEAG